jgi:cell division protein FtsL
LNTVENSRSVEHRPPAAKRRGDRKGPLTVRVLRIGGVMLAIGLIAFICGTAVMRTRKEFQAAHVEHQQVETEVKQLQLETERLLEEIQQLKSDPQVIERIAREELHMIRPDEMVLSFPDSQKK